MSTLVTINNIWNSEECLDEALDVTVVYIKTCHPLCSVIYNSEDVKAI